jgi:hypothetical protein
MAKDKTKDKELTKKADEKDKEFADPDLLIEGTKTPIEEGSEEMEAKSKEKEVPKVPAREMVRGEDVLKIMRAKGVKI